MAEGTDVECPQPFFWGMGDAYAVYGASMCPWEMGGGLKPVGVLPSSLQ